MRLSKSFVKTLRTAPKDETARGAQFLARAGYVHKELAGVYDYLPLGLKVLDNIKTIVREELNQIGCEEVQMSSLQNPELWQKTDRWDIEKMDIWFKTILAAGGELGLAPTHEEPFTEMMKSYLKSYKDLPVYAYQIQTKFRNELRAKSGIMRAREFIMKDLYSFSTDLESHDQFYHRAEQAYKKIYQRLGIGDCTFETFASGGVFAKYSHEFQTILDIGEDTIYFNQDKTIVINEEVLIDEVLDEMKVRREELTAAKAAEVGNIFTLKDKYSGPLGLEYATRDGTKKPVIMGCYGIGISRVMGVIAQKFADEKGLIWPESIAPYRYYLINIGDQATAVADQWYQNKATTVLYDDRDLRPGEKFADAELLGIPYRVVISDRNLENDIVEVTQRSTGKTEQIPLEVFLKEY